MAHGSNQAALRGLSLFINFFLIIFAYYLVKPASRSVYLEHFSADQLPYIWIATALTLGLLMPLYNRIIDRFNRRHVVISTCILFSVLLFVFNSLFESGMNAIGVAVLFYIAVDIMSVVLVEQFWSLTNSAYATDTGSKWYGFVGSGGLVGGIIAGLVASWLINRMQLNTFDLVYISATLLLVLGLYAALMMRLRIYNEQNLWVYLPGVGDAVGVRQIFANRYLFLIMIVILLAQLIEPIVEYQFMSYVELAYPEREGRTAYLSTFLSILGGVALTINLILTPLILKYLGAIGGMLLQPFILLLSSGFFSQSPDLNSGAILKISDRGLSYSINRAAKEMLYVPVTPKLIYQAKAWIDMFGYRLFKISGSLLILAFTQWLGVAWEPATFSYLVMPVCLVWLVAVLWLRPDYQFLRQREQTAQLSSPA